MAENKKSFILYAELIHTVRKLSKQKAGELFMTILSYVNDENPVIADPTVDLVFEPIKHQLKRDLKNWEAQRSRKAEAGKKGGINSGISRRKEAERSSASLLQANEAVNANVNVNVNAISIAGAIDENTVVEYLMDATNREYVKMEQIKQEAKEFKKKYDGMKIGNLRTLCNTWARNIKPWQEKKLSDFI